jgi:transposase
MKMNNSVTSESQTETQLPFTACVGLDWGDQTHAFSLCVQAEPADVQTGTLTNSPEALHAWLQQLAQRFGGQPIALAVETSRGPLIHLFSAYPWLTLYPIHPATSARYRAAFKPSGAKDDQPDALLLLELLRRHRDKLRPLQLPDTATRKLGALAELRRDLVDRRTQVILQTQALLKSYYPQGLELVGHDLTTTLALDFLSRWPDLLALKAARLSTVKRFYYTHSVRSQSLVQERLERVQNSRALTTDEAVVEPAICHLRLLLEQLRTFQKHIARVEAQMEQLFKQHREAYLFANLPGAGQALQPRLLVAFGEDRSLYPEPASLQKYSGVAPVIEKSGRQSWTHWRWHAPRFLRQTFVEWAGQTVTQSVWAGAYYKQMDAQGKSHHVILRALAFKWIRILWKCWQTRTPYDEERYLKHLAARKSPYAPATAS